MDPSLRPESRSWPKLDMRRPKSEEGFLQGSIRSPFGASKSEGYLQRKKTPRYKALSKKTLNMINTMKDGSIQEESDHTASPSNSNQSRSSTINSSPASNYSGNGKIPGSGASVGRKISPKISQSIDAVDRNNVASDGRLRMNDRRSSSENAAYEYTTLPYQNPKIHTLFTHSPKTAFLNNDFACESRDSEEEIRLANSKPVTTNESVDEDINVGSTEQQLEKQMKIFVVGDSKVGKSSIIRTLFDQPFEDTWRKTSGVDFRATQIQSQSGVMYRCQIWDTAGSDDLNIITKNYYKRANAFVLVFDVTNRQSFDALTARMNSIATFARDDAVILLAGNKCMINRREVEYSEGLSFAERYNVQYMELSVGEKSEGVIELFQSVLSIIEQTKGLRYLQSKIVSGAKYSPEGLSPDNSSQNSFPEFSDGNHNDFHSTMPSLESLKEQNASDTVQSEYENECEATEPIVAATTDMEEIILTPALAYQKIIDHDNDASESANYMTDQPVFEIESLHRKTADSSFEKEVKEKIAANCESIQAPKGGCMCILS